MSILRVNSITPYTGSLLTINGDIVITGNFTGSSIGNVGTRLTNLESETIALESFTSSFSTSVDSRLDVVEATASLYAPFSTSVNIRLDSVQTYTASVSTSVGILQSTASLYVPFSTSVNSRLGSIEAATASLQVSTNALNSVTASYATTGSNVFVGNQTISGSTVITGNLNIFGSASFTTVTSSIILGGNTIQLNTFSPVVRFGGISVIDSGSSGLTGSLLWDSEKDKWIYANPSGGAYDSAMLISGPKNTSGIGNELGLVTNYIVKAVGDDHISSSQMQDDGITVTIPYTASIGNIAGLGSPTVFSTSVDSRLDVVEATASLYIPFSTSVDSRLVSLATTGSNTFVGNQTVSGSLNVSSSILVNGSINANSLTGSINYNNLTNIPEGIVSGSSQITISSTTGYSDYSGSVATSISASSAAATAAATWTSLSGKPEGIVSGSSQITYSDITGIPTGIVSSSNQLTSSYDGRYVLSGSITQTTWDNIASKPEGIVSGSSQITISSTTGYSDYSGSVATSISASSAAATAAATWTSLSGKPEGIVSGSSQVNADSVTNFDENVKAKLDADSVVSGSLLGLLPTGVVSGSSQIDVTATTNYNTISSHISNTSNPHSVTASQVGLGNVTNESKATMFSSPTFTGTVSGVTATHVGLGNVTNESKATMFTDAALTGTPTAPTATANTNSTQIATTAYVQQELTDLIGGAPAAFDTLLEISASLAAGDSNLAGLVDGKLSKASNLSDLTDTSAARTNLGVAIGTNVQAYNSTLASVAGGTYSGDDSITTIGTVTAGNVAAILPTGTISGSSQVFSNVSGDVTIASNGVATIAANSVELGTDTTGSYVASLVAGTNITLTNNSGESATPTIGLTNNTISGISLGSNLATLTIGTGLSGTSYNGSGAVTIANTGVTSNVAGNAITVSGATGAVTINHADTSTAANLTASGRTYVSALTFDTYGHVTAYSTATETVTDTNTVTTNIAGTGISVSAGTGNSTITNTGVTSNVAGTGVTVSGATGAVTITNSDRGSSQNIFKNIAVSGQTTVVADGNDDTLTLAAGSNVTITTNATTDTITIASTDTNTTYSVGDGGLTAVNFTTTRRDKLDGIAAGATNVTNTNQLTNGAGYVTTSGVTSVTGTAPVASSGGATPAISMAAASSGVNGYMTGAYATKLDGIAAGATNVTNTNQLTNGAGFVTGQTVATSSNVQFNSLGVGKAASATAGRIEATQDIVAYSSSDRRFKENITPIQDALDKISKISGITFDWKAENKSEHGYEGNDVGVIAQEIEGVLPQLVQTRENGYKAVKYEKLVALLIEGIKELHNEINLLKNK